MTEERATIQRGKHLKNYVVVGNELVQNKALSWKARGLLVYILSLPTDWRIYISELANHATDGVDSTRTGFNELKDAGYITGGRKSGEDGKFYWRYEANEYPSPHGEIPYMDNPCMDNPHRENPTLQSTHEQSTHEQSTHEADDLFPDVPVGEKEETKATTEAAPKDYLDLTVAAARRKLDHGRPKGWRTATHWEYHLCQRVANLFTGGKLPWASDDIEKSLATANRMITDCDGDGRAAIRLIDEFHASLDADGPGFTVSGPYSLRNAIPAYIADRNKGSNGQHSGDGVIIRDGKRVMKVGM